MKKHKKKTKSKFPHFRKYYKSGHPALIVGEEKSNQKDMWKFKKVMHEPKDGRHLNDEVSPNPNKKDPRPMYIGRRVRKDEKKHFSPWKYKWKL